MVSFGNFPKLDYSAREAVNTLCTNLTFTGDKYRSIMPREAENGIIWNNTPTPFSYTTSVLHRQYHRHAGVGEGAVGWRLRDGRCGARIGSVQCW